MNMKRSVLIFGISGFVGRYLADEFYTNGYEVCGSDLFRGEMLPEYVDFYECDLLDSERVSELITETKPTHIVNLAAVSSVGLSWKIPQKTVAVNVGGTLNILEAAKKCETFPKILLIGSSEEYEISDKPLSEASPLNANNPYGISKMMQEQFSEIYIKRFGMKIYRVRSFNHTGVGQPASFVIPSWCRQAAEISKSGRSGIIKVGNLDVRRDFTDVRDIVRAYRTVIESDSCEQVYNIGSGKAVLLRDMLDHIISLSEQPVEIQTDSELFRPADNPFICCDNSLIRRQLGWKTEYDIFDTVKEIFYSF